MFLVIVAAAVVIALIAWTVVSRTNAHLQGAASRVVGRGEFVDGNRRLRVALSVTDRAFYYESSSVDASLDLKWIEEVDYDTRLATGRTIAGGQVMRLRCQSQVFEFVVPNADVLAWKAALPSHREPAFVAPPEIAAGTA